MTWALQFDGVNDYLALGTGTYMHQRLDAGDWAYSIDAIIPSTTNDLLLLGRASVAAGYLAIKNNQIKLRYQTSSSSDVTIATTHVFDGSRITLDIYREAGGVHKVAVDGVVVGSTTSANVGAEGSAITSQIGKRSSTVNTVAFQLISLQFKNGVAGSVVYDWDAEASSHAPGAQPILTETVTANDATGVNFPTDGSAWVDLGGGGASTLVADSGGYTYTGTAATLTVPVSSTLAADTGGYSYTGANAALFKGSVLNTDTANYTYSGTDVTLTYTPAGTNLLAPDAGNYSYSGGDITFSRNRVIITSSGNYTYSGSGVSIILPGQIWTDKPTAVTTYTNKPAATTNWTDK